MQTRKGQPVLLYTETWYRLKRYLIENIEHKLKMQDVVADAVNNYLDNKNANKNR
jgi:hypothetical protein